MDKNAIFPEYIILTHEHTDHTWGCNTLLDKYNSKIVCSRFCRDALPKEGRAYFQFYYDDSNYEYAVKKVDILIEDINCVLKWNEYDIYFIPTPGHSDGSVCFSIDDNLFTGDTLMQYKPFIPKKKGSSEKLQDSIESILNKYPLTTVVYPGHGDSFLLSKYNKIYL